MNASLLKRLYPEGVPPEAYETLEIELRVAEKLMRGATPEAPRPPPVGRGGPGKKRAPFTKGKSGDMVHLARFIELREKGHTVGAARKILRVGATRGQRLEKLRLRRESKAAKPKKGPKKERASSAKKEEYVQRLKEFLSGGTRTFEEIRREMGDMHFTGVYKYLGQVPGLEKIYVDAAAGDRRMLYSIRPATARNGVGAHP